MKLHRVIVKSVLLGVFIAAFSVGLMPHKTYAETCSNGTTIPDDAFKKDKGASFCKCIDQNNDAYCTSSSGFTLNPAGSCEKADCITDDIQIAVDFLAAGVGIIITIMIVVGAIQYTMSRDNPQAVQAAKSKIFNAIFALIAFIFIYAFLRWIVQGVIFKK